MMEAQATEKRSSQGSYYLRIVGTLCLITIIVGAALSAINLNTKPIIDRLKEEKRQSAMSAVMPGADLYSQVPFDDATIKDINGAFVGSSLQGYCVEVASNGFGGAIDLMVGVTVSGEVTGVVVLAHAETAGLGTKATDPSFLDQYKGLSGTINVKTGDNAITPVSGATITSKAVTKGVNLALAAIANLDTEGGLSNDSTI